MPRPHSVADTELGLVEPRVSRRIRPDFVGPIASFEVLLASDGQDIPVEIAHLQRGQLTPAGTGTSGQPGQQQELLRAVRQEP